MTGWELRDFLKCFDDWVEREDPPADWRVDAMWWIHGLQDDVYRGAARHPELGVGWWFARIPGAEDENAATVCLYAVDERRRRARCSAITTLSKPLE